MSARAAVLTSPLFVLLWLPAAARAEAGQLLHPDNLPRQASYFETHMQWHLGITEHGELHRRLLEAAEKVQREAEAVAAAGTGTSEYLQWRLAREDERARSRVLRERELDDREEGNFGHFVESEPIGGMLHRRKLEVVGGSSGNSSLSPPPLNSPPGPADINITAVRHDSVVPPALVDWRLSSTVNTPVFDQKACESCWLWAAADIISMKWALLSYFLTPVPLSPQHVCDCGFGGKCCTGGWPEWTFLFAQLNKGVAPLANYPYLAKNYQSCNKKFNTSLLTGKITGWEKLPASDPAALIKTVSMHPVVVLMYVSSSFLRYAGGIWRGTDCPKKPSVNHAVIVMGFNVSSNDPYWIVKNSWGTGWGEAGYIRISMVTSLCEFGSQPSIYPTMFRVKTPCDAVPPPCGNGTCYLMADGVTARCQCPAGFVERLQDSAPKCVNAAPCDVAVNPCAFGTCNNEFDGTYTCTCPPGSVVGSRADGDETCIVNSFQSGLITTMAATGDDCTAITSTFNITLSSLITMNPFLDCSLPIPPGTVLVVGGPNAANAEGCGGRDAIAPGDTCSSIAQRNGIPVSQFLILNPGINCSSLLVTKHVCVALGQLATVSPFERSCGQVYDTDVGESCFSIASDFNVSLQVLEWLNPGIDCMASSLPPTSVCVAPLMLGWAGVSCNASYNVTHADTCYTVAAAAGLDLDDFLLLNPGLRCNWPHWVVGLSVCIQGTASPLSEVELQPNFVPVYVRTNDTLESLAVKYAGLCVGLDGENVTPAALKNDICWANGWQPQCSNRMVVPGSMILVPCMNPIGASFCPYSTVWVCGSNGVTYPSTACANAAFVTPIAYGTGCSGCSSPCSGLSGANPDLYYGGTTYGCASTYSCPYPPAPDYTGATASQWCTSSASTNVRCQYSRVLCSASLWKLSSPTNCQNFAACLKLQLQAYGMTMSQCPYTSTACNEQYALPGCYT